MSEIYAVVEGLGEKLFGEQVLAVHLGNLGIAFRATQAGKPGQKSAAAPWEKIRRDVLKFLRMNKPGRPVYVTTMYDYFRMPLDWPGRQEASARPWHERGAVVEAALAKDVKEAMGDGFIESRFIPYVQVHELEALILAQPETLKQEFPDREAEVDQLVAEIGDAEPESVNDGPVTAPGKRIIARIPEYDGRKALAAANTLNLIPLDTLRQKCQHFNQWLERLERIEEIG
jgi:hypothetical protein